MEIEAVAGDSFDEEGWSDSVCNDVGMAGVGGVAGKGTCHICGGWRHFSRASALRSPRGREKETAAKARAKGGER